MKELNRSKNNKDISGIQDDNRNMERDSGNPFPSNPFEQAFNMTDEDQNDESDRSNVTMHPAFLPRIVKETNDETVILDDGQRKINIIDKQDKEPDIPVINRLGKEAENNVPLPDEEKNEDTFKKVIKIPDLADPVDKKEVSPVTRSFKKNDHISPPPLFEPVLPDSDDLPAQEMIKDQDGLTGPAPLQGSIDQAGSDPFQRGDIFPGSLPERPDTTVSFFEMEQKSTDPFIPSKIPEQLQPLKGTQQAEESPDKQWPVSEEPQTDREQDNKADPSTTRDIQIQDADSPVPVSTPKFQGILNSIIGGVKKLVSKKNLIDRMEEVQRDGSEAPAPGNEPESLNGSPEKNNDTENSRSPSDEKNATYPTEDKTIADTTDLATMINPAEQIRPAEEDENAFRKVTPINPDIISEESPDMTPLTRGPSSADKEVTDNELSSLAAASISKSGSFFEDHMNQADEDRDMNTSSLNQLKEELDNSRKDNERLSGDIRDMNKRMNTIHNSLQPLESSQALIQSGLENNGIKITDLEKRLTTIEEVAEQLHLDNVDMTRQLGLIADNITQLSDHYTIVFGHMQKMTDFSNEMSGDLFNACQRIDMLEQGLKEFGEGQTRLEDLSSQINTSMDKRLNDLEKRNEDIKKSSLEENVKLSEGLEQLTDFVEKELKNLGGRSYRALGESVHLCGIIKNSTNMKLCMEWLEFLMELVGSNNLDDILSYYEELGWISAEVRLELLRYSEGIDHYIEKPDWKLTPDDHVKSIWFIERLAGIKVDKNTLSMMEKDIKKVKKGSEIYGI